MLWNNFKYFHLFAEKCPLLEDNHVSYHTTTTPPPQFLLFWIDTFSPLINENDIGSGKDAIGFDRDTIYSSFVNHSQPVVPLCLEGILFQNAFQTPLLFKLQFWRNLTLSEWKWHHFSPKEKFNIESIENLLIFLQIKSRQEQLWKFSHLFQQWNSTNFANALLPSWIIFVLTE